MSKHKALKLKALASLSHTVPRSDIATTSGLCDDGKLTGYGDGGLAESTGPLAPQGCLGDPTQENPSLLLGGPIIL